MGSCGKPANAKSSYNFFTSIMHEEFKSLFPGKTADFIDFQRKCAGKWKLLSPEDKAPFEKIASSDKLRFQEGSYWFIHLLFIIHLECLHWEEKPGFTI